MNFEIKHKLDLLKWVMNVSGLVFTLSIPISIWIYVGWIDLDDASLVLAFLLVVMAISVCLLVCSIISCLRILDKELKV